MRAVSLNVRPLAIKDIYGGEAIYQGTDYVIEKAPGYEAEGYEAPVLFRPKPPIPPKPSRRAPTDPNIEYKAIFGSSDLAVGNKVKPEVPIKGIKSQKTPIVTTKASSVSKIPKAPATIPERSKTPPGYFTPGVSHIKGDKLHKF